MNKKKMEPVLPADVNWIKVSLILCIFGFFKELRPSEPFITDYLTGPWKNFTFAQVNQEIYPVGTYCYFITLIFVLLITDFLCYKPIIILCGLSGIATYLIMILTHSIFGMQLVEFFYGLFLSTEVAYYTYIYAKVDKKHYQQVTGYTRAAFLFGRFIAGITAQLTVSFNILNYHQLIFISLSALIFATMYTFFLPSVDRSMYFHQTNITSNIENRKNSETSNDIILSLTHQVNSELSCSQQSLPENQSNKRSSLAFKIKRAYSMLWKDFVSAYTNMHVVKWSFWWAFATCGYFQVINYIQLLWQTCVNSADNVYNGAAEAIYTIIGALAILGVGKLWLNWPLFGEATLSIFSFIEGILLLSVSYSYNIWFSYVTYIAFGVIYHVIITISSSEIAKHILEDSHGLIFGVNTLLALLLQSLVTFIVVSESIFTLSIRAQYIVYGTYFIALGVVFMITATYTIVQQCKSNTNIRLWLNDGNLI